VVITITTPVGGLLETVQVDRGDLVKEGQILATLDTSIERAQGSVQHAQAELTNRRLADLELQRTTAEVALRTIKSPVNGVVVERVVDAASGTFSVRMELPNTDFKLPAGLKCSVRFGKNE